MSVFNCSRQHRYSYYSGYKTLKITEFSFLGRGDCCTKITAIWFVEGDWIWIVGCGCASFLSWLVWPPKCWLLRVVVVACS